MNKREYIIVIAVLVALPLAYFLLSPLFFDRTVDESFPTPAGEENILNDSEMAAKATQMMEEAQSDLPAPVQDSMPAEMAEMEILLQGKFYDLAHHGMGTATIYRLADSSRVLRFENFEVLNGPDLHVYLAVQDPVPNTVGVELAGSIDLGKLKGNIGDQNYLLPSNLDLEAFQSVVIWCQPFRVPFSAAALSAGS